MQHRNFSTRLNLLLLECVLDTSRTFQYFFYRVRTLKICNNPFLGSDSDLPVPPGSQSRAQDEKYQDCVSVSIFFLPRPPRIDTSQVPSMCGSPVSRIFYHSEPLIVSIPLRPSVGGSSEYANEMFQLILIMRIVMLPSHQH